jgi:serine/threonine protein kinase
VLTAGETLGGCTLVEPKGNKGTAELWLGRSADGDQVLLTIGRVKSAGREPRVRTRLEASFQNAKKLQHPSLVRVLAVGVERGLHFVVSEMVDGVLLQQLFDRSPGQAIMSPTRAAWVTLELARALAYLHAHDGPLSLARGLTPSAVLLTRDGTVKIAGMVAAEETQDLVETAGQDQLGGAAYLSPEMVKSGAKDVRSDVYALGTIFWELLSGKPLFKRASDLETLEAVRTADIPPLPQGIPLPIARVVTACLSKAPEERYADANRLVSALTEALSATSEVGPSAIAGLVEQAIAASAPKRRTALLSEADQAPSRRPSHDKTIPSGPPIAVGEHSDHHTQQSDPPSGAIRAGAVMRETRPSDPFFDPARDAGAISNPRFEVLGRLGAGGMGEVYRVRDQELNEIVALKVIPRHAAGDAQSLERLRREVRLARRISSDHVCRIFDIVDLGNGGRGLTMAMVKGVTLAELMKSGVTLDYRRFARWGGEIADGLAAAHGLSIVHRDLKPENVMIASDDDRAVILDFGIARTAADAPEPTDNRLTQAGIIMGTPLYMSPEQLTNRPLDGRSDLYALGLILAELITGEVPLKGEGYSQILEERVLKATPFMVRNVDPNVPEAFASVIDGLLKPAAQDRPATSTQVSQQLLAFSGGKLATGALAGESVPKGVATPDIPQPRNVGKRRHSSTTRRPKPKSSSKGVLIGLLVLVASLIGIGVLANRAQRPIEPLPIKPPPIVEPEPPLIAPPPFDAGVVEAPPDAGKKKPTVAPIEEM